MTNATFIGNTHTNFLSGPPKIYLASNAAYLGFDTNSPWVDVTYYMRGTITAEYSDGAVMGGVAGAAFGTTEIARITPVRASDYSRTQRISLVAFNGGAIKSVFVFAGLKSLGDQLYPVDVRFAAGSITTAHARPTGKKILFFGDSIWCGDTAVAGRNWNVARGLPKAIRAAYPTNEIGWDAAGSRKLSDDGYSGAGADGVNSVAMLGRFANFAANTAAFNGGAIWFGMGRNDYSAAPTGSAAFGTALAAWLADVKAQYPGLTIVVQSIVTVGTGEGANSIAYRAAEAAAASAAGVTYVDGLTILATGDVSIDQTHPDSITLASKFVTAVQSVIT